MLQTQCRRLEAQHYSLSLTAEQLSHSMAVSWGFWGGTWPLQGIHPTAVSPSILLQRPHCPPVSLSSCNPPIVL